jgi:hypothetical protein
MSNNIHWAISAQNLRQELVSADRRWHIAKTQNGGEEPKFFLSNYDLLLTPHGTGSDYKECFDSFIADCDKFASMIGKIKAEAREHLDALLKAGSETGSEA